MKTINIILCVISVVIVSINATAQSTSKDSTNLIMEKINKLDSLHDSKKSLSVQVLFKGTEGVTRSLQIQKNGELSEHTTQTKAILICVSGEVIYEDEKDVKQSLKAGEYYFIEPKVKHWVKGVSDSQLLLIK